MPDMSELCAAVLERCEQAKALSGEERRLYLLDALNKVTAMVELFAANGAKAKVLPFHPNIPTKEEK